MTTRSAVHGVGAPRSGRGAQPLTAGTSRVVAKRSARGHGPRFAGWGDIQAAGAERPHGLRLRGGAARPVEMEKDIV